MWLRSVTALLFSFFSTVLAAQTVKLGGKVLNDKNEPQQGVSVKVTNGPGTSTGTDGSFTLSLAPGTKYEITFSSVGYATKKLSDVEVGATGANELNITLEIASTNLTGVVVQSTAVSARRENVASIIQFQKNTNTVASVISAETIRRSPDRNTGEVLKRTPGASIQEGRFIIVRGLADRYNQAMLNGILLTSTEPDRKTFSFDLIPSAMIDNIIINKAFVPELPGEWAGGLIQVNTKDIPTKGFFNLQVGTGFNTQTIGRTFYRDRGGKLDWLGIDDGTRALPSSYTTKSGFDRLSLSQKSAIGSQLRDDWSARQTSAPLNASFQANGGFTTRVFGKKTGGTFGLLYNKSNRFIDLYNQSNTAAGTVFSANTQFNDDRYQQDISIGAIGSLSMQLNPLNRVSLKALINVNSTNHTTRREGVDVPATRDLRGTEALFKQNTFFTTQLTGDHTLNTKLKLRWYGAFNILDGYIPDQRRILYYKEMGTANPYRLLLSSTLSQQSGSRIFQMLNDYIYTTGGDLSYSFNAFGQKQTLKGGYMLQVKDRLYDGQFYANFIAKPNDAIESLPADRVFAAENFGNGEDNRIGFNAIQNKNFRYLANTILNAGFLQMDNQFSPALRVVWGGRIEHYDQLVGSVKVSDTRHTYSKVLDFLPGLNATYKLNQKTNIRLSGSQTVIRPELRELTALNIYDFELNASVSGNPKLKRTKITNFDLRYELYPRGGEAFTAGVFYKYFKTPIEQYFDEAAGGASTFTFINSEKATTFGAEVELRKRLDFLPILKNFTFQSNVSYIRSRVESKEYDLDRPLQGQSPYVLNISMLYDLPASGFNATLLYNQIGRRIYYVGQNSLNIGGAPDIYEASRPLLDFQVSKKVIKSKGEIKLNIADILNRRQYFYQNIDKKTSFEKGSDAYRFTRKLGTTVGLTFNYSI
jgi:outer membrane receptor protein involved in Fe transport